MKRICLAILLVFVGFCTINAQDVSGKEVVCVQSFSHADNIGTNYVEMLRNKVIEGMTKTNRFRLIDAESDPVLKAESQRRTQESALNDDNAMLESIKTLGANYVLSGHVASITSTRNVDSKGNVSYNSKVTFQLKVYELSTGTVISNKTFEASSSSLFSLHKTQGDAIVGAVDNADNPMKNFVDEVFKIQGAIVEISESKKDEAKKVYISIGSDKGILKGQKLDVYMEREVAGRKASKLIGELKVEAVEAGDLSFCKVTKGGKEIFEAVNEGKKVTVITKVNGNIFGL
ncbi:MAG: hypothetical protein PHR45_00795 [Muribaculaceae bacterium]|nr:hypothetical protein [Muribaculaceae bacterium]